MFRRPFTGFFGWLGVACRAIYWCWAHTLNDCQRGHLATAWPADLSLLDIVFRDGREIGRYAGGAPETVMNARRLSPAMQALVALFWMKYRSHQRETLWMLAVPAGAIAPFTIQTSQATSLDAEMDPVAIDLAGTIKGICH